MVQEYREAEPEVSVSELRQLLGPLSGRESRDIYPFTSDAANNVGRYYCEK